MKNKKLLAFTLAEVLITLAIIGVVAALTIPTVITNYQKKMYVTQLKKSYNNITNGFKTYMAREGVTKLTDTTLWSKISAGNADSRYLFDAENKDLKDEFLKIFNVLEIYDFRNFQGDKVVYKSLDGKQEEDSIYAIALADGSWLYFNFIKNPNNKKCNGKECSSLKEFQETNNTPTKLWYSVGDIDFDINGAKGPNVYGRDAFLFVLANDGTLYPWGGKDVAMTFECTYESIDSCDKYWKNNGPFPCLLDSDGTGCAGRIMEENWKMNY